MNAFTFDDGRDPYLSDGLLRAIEWLGRPGVARLVELAASGVEKNRAKVVEAFAVLRTRQALEAIPTLLENPHLNIAQRAALIRSYLNYRSERAASPSPALNHLIRQPDEAAEVKLTGLEVLSAAGELKGDRAAAWVAALLAEKKPVFRREAFRMLGITPEDARLVGRLFLDRELPRELRPEVVEALRRRSRLKELAKEIERTSPE